MCCLWQISNYFLTPIQMWEKRVWASKSLANMFRNLWGGKVWRVLIITDMIHEKDGPKKHINLNVYNTTFSQHSTHVNHLRCLFRSIYLFQFCGGAGVYVENFSVNLSEGYFLCLKKWIYIYAVYKGSCLSSISTIRQIDSFKNMLR